MQKFKNFKSNSFNTYIKRPSNNNGPSNKIFSKLHPCVGLNWAVCFIHGNKSRLKIAILIVQLLKKKKKKS